MERATGYYCISHPGRVNIGNRVHDPCHETRKLKDTAEGSRVMRTAVWYCSCGGGTYQGIILTSLSGFLLSECVEMVAIWIKEYILYFTTDIGG